jgi:flagellar biosynthesis protein FlhG
MTETLVAPGRAAGTARGTGRLIAIASGKGGVGKTWLSITLAHALAQAGACPLLFDGDLGLANVDVQLGLPVGRDIGPLLRGDAGPESCITNLPLGFSVLAGRSGSGAFAALPDATIDRLAAQLAGIEGYTHVLLDLGAGLDRTVRRMAATAETLLVVTTDEPTALTDAYAALKLAAHDRPDGDRRVVVNMASSRSAGEKTHATLAQAAEKFLGARPKLAAIIRRDPRVPEAIRRQTPLLTRHPHSDAAADVAALARSLLG